MPAALSLPVRRLAAALVLLALLSPPLLAQGYDPTKPRGPAPSDEPAVPLAQGYDPTKPRGPAPSDEPAVPLNPEFDDLPDTPGVEETFYLCTACHSTAIIKQQHVSDAQWDYLWTWMIEAQGMPEVDEETSAIILAYLKQHFSSER